MNIKRKHTKARKQAVEAEETGTGGQFEDARRT